LKQRFFIIVFLLLFIVVIAAAVAANRGGTNSSVTQERPDPKLQFTIQSDTVGNDIIIVTNEATGARITITQNMLPFTANFAKGDVLTFMVVPREGYIFNAWAINDGTWESSNPLSVRPSGDFTMKAYFLTVPTVIP
jgi:hypothetical protein